MLWKLLADDANNNQQIMLYIMLGAVIVIFVVWMLFSNRKSKRTQKEYIEQLEAIRPGHKVKTAGGICGIVAEVCDDNTVIIETGSEQTGKSYIKMDKELIVQTDAKGPTQLAREAAEAQKKAEKAAKNPSAKPEPAAPSETQPETPRDEQPKE